MRSDHKISTPPKPSDIESIDDAIGLLPTRSFSKNGLPMEPVNLILIGSQSEIDNLFSARGWRQAEKMSLMSVLRAALSSLFNWPYPTGPASRSYINAKPHKLCYQLATAGRTFRRRHHLRLWPTRIRLHDERIWVGTLSYDRSIGLRRDRLWPTHHISPGLFYEEEFLAHALGTPARFVKIGKHETGTMNTGDKYIWNGRALLVDASGHHLDVK